MQIFPSHVIQGFVPGFWVTAEISKRNGSQYLLGLNDPTIIKTRGIRHHLGCKEEPSQDGHKVMTDNPRSSSKAAAAHA